MNVVNISIKDMAGVGYYLCKLLNEKTNYKCNQVSVKPHYHSSGMYWNENKKLVENLLEEADVIHINSPNLKLEKGVYHNRVFPVNVSKYLGKKKIIAHYHGGDLKQIHNKKKFFSKMKKKGIPCFVSTPELLKIHPYLRWFPSPVNLDLKPLPMKKRYERLTIFHATVFKHRKDAPFMKGLMKGIKDINYIPTYGAYKYNDMLAKMSKSHILFNHFYPFYGVAAIEASMLGLVVLTNVSNILKKYAPDVSFTHVSKKSIKRRINILRHSSKKHMYTMGLMNRKFVMKYHCDKIIKLAKEVYE